MRRLASASQLRTKDAKRLECAGLPALFGVTAIAPTIVAALRKSGSKLSKLHALQTLRAI